MFDIVARRKVIQPDLSCSRGGAAGVGGLLYLSVSNSNSQLQLFIPWYDSNGNIMGYWDERGKVAASFDYDAFGETSAYGDDPAAFPIRFSTKYHDVESDLYNYTKRYYSPSLHRWLTRDPIEEDGGVNLYAMCYNDPTSQIDALGLTRVALTTSVKAMESNNGRMPFAAISMTVVDPPKANNKLYFIQLVRDKGKTWRVDNSGSVAGPYCYSQVQMDRYSTLNSKGQRVVTLYDAPNGQLSYVDFISAAVEVSRSCWLEKNKVTKRKIDMHCHDVVEVLAYKRWRFNPSFDPRYDFTPPADSSGEQFVPDVLGKLIENVKWRIEICPSTTITVKRR